MKAKLAVNNTKAHDEVLGFGLAVCPWPPSDAGRCSSSAQASGLKTHSHCQRCNWVKNCSHEDLAESLANQPAFSPPKLSVGKLWWLFFFFFFLKKPSIKKYLFLVGFFSRHFQCLSGYYTYKAAITKACLNLRLIMAIITITAQPRTVLLCLIYEHKS